MSSITPHKSTTMLVGSAMCSIPTAQSAKAATFAPGAEGFSEKFSFYLCAFGVFSVLVVSLCSFFLCAFGVFSVVVGSLRFAQLIVVCVARTFYL